MKNIILAIVALLIYSTTVLGGIDEMRKRDPGMPPDNPGNGNGNGNGGGNGGGNPNVPVDDYVWVLGLASAAYGIYTLSKRDKKIAN